MKNLKIEHIRTGFDDIVELSDGRSITFTIEGDVTVKFPTGEYGYIKPDGLIFIEFLDGLSESINPSQVTYNDKGEIELTDVRTIFFLNKMPKHCIRYNDGSIKIMMDDLEIDIDNFCNLKVTTKLKDGRNVIDVEDKKIEIFPDGRQKIHHKGGKIEYLNENGTRLLNYVPENIEYLNEYGKLHREDGPAVEYKHDSSLNEYWFDGHKVENMSTVLNLSYLKSIKEQQFEILKRLEKLNK